MPPSLATWITLPLVGALIGYATNWLAVKMIFRPIRPVRVLGVRVQGLMGKRQGDLARSIGKVVGGHLVGHDDVVRSFAKVDFDRLLGDVLERGMAPKVQELRSLPLIGGFLTEERVAGLKASLVQGILQHKELVLERLETAVEEGLDVRALVAEKVAAFPVEKLESLVLEVASRELRAIEVLGGVLGGLIGLGQVFLLWALA
ncbi:MAG: DUF445 family protein [Planctomycetes bacterium]|nr:DUF445 family protein [Planctomycetota bacterium]